MPVFGALSTVQHQQQSLFADMLYHINNNLPGKKFYRIG